MSRCFLNFSNEGDVSPSASSHGAVRRTASQILRLARSSILRLIYEINPRDQFWVWLSLEYMFQLTLTSVFSLMIK